MQLANIRNILRENLSDQQRHRLKQTTIELVTPHKGDMTTPGMKAPGDERLLGSSSTGTSGGALLF